MVESSEGFLSIGSEGILHNLISEVINEFNMNSFSETPAYNALLNLYNFLNGIAQSEPYNENSAIFDKFKKPKSILDAYQDLEVIFEYTLKRGFMIIPEKPPSWEDNELEIVPTIPNEYAKMIRDEDVKKLYKIMKEDREDEMTNNIISKWIDNYNLFLNLYEAPFVDLKVKNRNTKKDAPSKMNPQFIIERLFLRKGKCGILYGGQGAGKSNFLSWLVGIILLYTKKWTILTNVPLFTDNSELQHLTPDRIKIVHTLSETLDITAKLLLEGKTPVILIDEIDQDVNSHKWQGKRTESLYNLVLIMRHLKIRMILFYHDFNHIPQWLRGGDLAGEYIRLLAMPNSNVHFAFSENTQPFSFFIPISWIPYATHGWNGFDIDVHIADLSRKLKGTTISELAKNLIDIIPQLEPIDKQKKTKATKSTSEESIDTIAPRETDTETKPVVTTKPSPMRLAIIPENGANLQRGLYGNWTNNMKPVLKAHGLIINNQLTPLGRIVIDETGRECEELNIRSISKAVDMLKENIKTIKKTMTEEMVI